MAIIEKLKHFEVEGIRVGRFTSKIYTTCIVYRMGATIIDTGPPNQWQFVRAFLQEKKIDQVLITHHHEDHGGNGANLQAELNLPVLCHRDGISNHTKGFPLQLYRRITWGTPAKFQPEILNDPIEVGTGIRLMPIHSLGHAEDMLCFLAPERGWLFGGDVFIASKPKFLRHDENPNLQIESLRKILRHDFDTLFCAHRGIISDGHQALQDKLDYLENLREEVLALRKQGKSINEITRELLGKEESIAWMTFFHFSKRNLVRGFMETNVEKE